jgi:cell wall-associated NlpC family hydrolase
VRRARAARRLYRTREAYADLRRRPSHDAALVSQSVMGEPLALVRERGEWLEVEAKNGYRGWVRSWALEPDLPGERAFWQTRPIARVVVPCAPLRAEPRAGAPRVAEAGFLARFPLIGKRRASYLVLLPGRGPAWLPAASAEVWPDAGSPPPPPGRLVRIASRLLGTPYLWGGTSSRGYDCSGLVMRLYEWAGLALPRDSRQQAALGYDFTDPGVARPGDLLFFAERGRPVSHVALALGRGAILHASRSSVRVETIAPPPGRGGSSTRGGSRASGGSSASGSLGHRPDLAAMFRGGRRYPRGTSGGPARRSARAR